MLSYMKYVFMLLVINLFADINFTNPISTPTPQVPPNLSQLNEYAEGPQIATDASGRYVYAIWYRKNGSAPNVFIIQVAISDDYGATWKNPTSTLQGSPNLSEAGRNASDPQITTDASGKYVYAIWFRSDATVFFDIIQVAISDDYGATWKNPTSTPQGFDTPNITQNDKSAADPQIATDSTGRYVYAIWFKQNAVNQTIIQVATSNDYGKNWTYPISTPQGSPNLSLGNANNPQITIDASGRYVYAIWSRVNTSGWQIIEVAISDDYGKNWIYPTSTPQGSPNLSQTDKNAFLPQISTDSSGRYIYAIWYISIGNNIVQVAISDDYGKNWTYPTSTPQGPNTANLSQSGKNAEEPQIATDASGRYVYAIWKRNNGTNFIIQVALSDDNGKNWEYPTSTLQGSPNLSQADQDAELPQIATDASGRYVYAIWVRFESNYIIQSAISDDFGSTWKNPTSTTQGTPNLSEAGQNANDPQIATDASGRHIYAIWYRFNGSTDIIQVAISLRIPKIHLPKEIRPIR